MTISLVVLWIKDISEDLDSERNDGTGKQLTSLTRNFWEDCQVLKLMLLKS